MVEDAEAPIFKTGKKRKFFQARARDRIEQEDDQPEARTLVPDQNDSHATASSLKRSRKHGIGFSDAKAAPSEHTAVIVPTPTTAEPRDDRFVKSTGKAMVSEDKYMSAFIDARLAALSTVPGSIGAKNASDGSESDDSVDQVTQTESLQTTKLKLEAIPLKRSSRRRPRRVPAPPTQADIDRDSAVDRLMQQGAASLYDQSTALKASDGHGENDAAAAAAFKAEFLATLEDKRHARKTATSTTSGPKPGGGRMVQRMKATEEQNKQKDGT